MSGTNMPGTISSEKGSELEPRPTTITMTRSHTGGDRMAPERSQEPTVPPPVEVGPASWSAYAAAGVPVAGLGSDLAQLGELAPLLGVGLAAAAVVAARRAPGPQRRGLPLPPRWRVRLRLRPGPGFASRPQLYRHYGRWTARRIAKWGRPSLTWRDRWLGPWEEYAFLQGRAQGLLHRWGVYTTQEDLVLVIAPPQEGKSQHAAAIIAQAPGPVVATSIRGDLIRETAGLRQQRGWTWILNPEQIGAYAGNMQWNIVAGCEDILVAVRRAGYMVEASEARGLSDAAFWQDWSAMSLAAFMHAAALMGGSMRDVYTWVMDREEAEHALWVLDEHEQAHPVARQVLHQLQTMGSEKTRDSIITTLSRVLRFMIHPEVAATLCPPVGGFDFQEFLRSRDTVYLVSSADSSTPTAPVFAAFLAELQAVAHLLGSRAATGEEGARRASRLDPPLTIVGDELANTAPVPVDRWASWAAGTGIVIYAYFQTWARVQERWGQHGAEALWGSFKTKVIGSGVTEDEVLTRMSRLIGKVSVREDGLAGRRRQGWSKVDVISPAEIRRIPRGRALILRSGAPAPTIVSLQSIRKMAAYRKWLKAGAPIEGLMPIRPREIPTARPELATSYGPEPAAPVDDLAAWRARRARPAPPPLNLPPRPDEDPQDEAGEVPEWSPWQQGGSA